MLQESSTCPSPGKEHKSAVIIGKGATAEAGSLSGIAKACEMSCFRWKWHVIFFGSELEQLHLSLSPLSTSLVGEFSPRPNICQRTRSWTAGLEMPCSGSAWFSPGTASGPVGFQTGCGLQCFGTCTEVEALMPAAAASHAGLLTGTI